MLSVLGRYQVDDNTSGYFQLQSIFIPAPNKTSSSNAVSTASSGRADSVSVKTSFSSVGPVEDSEQHAVDSSANSNSQVRTHLGVICCAAHVRSVTCVCVRAKYS